MIELVSVIELVVLQQETSLDVGEFKLIPTLMVFGMLGLFLMIGLVFRVTEVDDLWVAGRSIGAVENGMAIGANWLSAASYLGVASLIALSGYYGMAYVVGWTTGYFILLIFLAAQFRRFGKYTAPDFVGDRYYSPWARAIAAVTILAITIPYAISQASGMGLMGQYVFGASYEVSVILFMGVTLGYVILSGMLGTTKNMAIQYAILIVAFTIGLYATGWSQGWTTAVPYLEYGNQMAAVAEIEAQFVEPFANTGPYGWIALVFTLVLGTCGLPHVLVRFYTVENERTARWSTVWGLFFICLLYWGTVAYAVFGSLLYDSEVTGGGFDQMLDVEADALVLLTTQLAELPEWIVGLVAAGAVAAAIATVSGLFVTASSAAAHDIYTNLYKDNASQREQMVVGRLTIAFIGIISTVIGLNPPALVAELVAFSFAIAACVFFPVFFLGLWWENATKEGAIAGMLTGIVFSVGAITNDTVIPMYTGVEGAFIPELATILPGTSPALITVPTVFIVIIVVSLITDDPPERVKRIVRQCHSPEPITDSAEATANGGTPADD